MAAAREQEIISTEIVNKGIEDSGPYAGSLNFSVRVRHGLPNFLNSVNLEYVRLGYGYLLSHGFYLFTAPFFILILSAGIAKLTWNDFFPQYDLSLTLLIFGLLAFIVFLCLHLIPRSIYLVDFACYRPPNQLKVIPRFLVESSYAGFFFISIDTFDEKCLHRFQRKNSWY